MLTSASCCGSENGGSLLGSIRVLAREDTTVDDADDSGETWDTPSSPSNA